MNELIDAIQKYFNLMYDCNIANFADVFSPRAGLVARPGWLRAPVLKVIA